MPPPWDTDSHRSDGRGARVALEYDVGSPQVPMEGLPLEVRDAARPQRQLALRSLRDADEHVVVLSPRRGREREEDVAAPHAADEAEGGLQRPDLPHDLGQRPSPHPPAPAAADGVQDRPGRGGELLGAPRRHVVRHALRVDDEAEHLEARCHGQVGLGPVDDEAEVLEHRDDRSGPRLVSNLAHRGLEVVDVVDEGVHEAAPPNDGRRHRRDPAEGVARDAEAERQHGPDVVDAVEREAQQGVETHSHLDVVVGALEVGLDEQVPLGEALDEVPQLLEREVPRLEEVVEEPTVVDEPQLAVLGRAARLLAAEDGHDDVRPRPRRVSRAP